MRKTYFLFVIGIFLFANIELSAQVTIGSDIEPEKAALLDIKTIDGGSNGDISSSTGGILFPRVEIESLTKLNVFSGIPDSQLSSEEQKERHKGLSVFNIGTANVEAGIYTWNGTKWEKSGTKKEINFFYMPSIPIDLSVKTPPPIELYEEYRKQFLTPKAASTGAPANVPYYLSANDLYYYVTGYDEDIFESVSITNTGRMTYTLKDDLPASVCCSYINILFVIK